MPDKNPARDANSIGLDVPSRPIAPLPPLSSDEDAPADLPPELEDEPVADELTGRASKTEDDLGALFSNETEEHLDDGFKGGSGDDPGGESPDAA